MSISYEEYMAKQSPEFNLRVDAKAEELSLSINFPKTQKLLDARYEKALEKFEDN